MKGDAIPRVTWVVGDYTEKRPKYRLRSAEEEAAEQEKLGKMISYYCGTSCERCCGVYPRYYTDETFEAKGYYVCLVCGKESTHSAMPWMSRDAWNRREYLWEP